MAGLESSLVQRDSLLSKSVEIWIDKSHHFIRFYINAHTVKEMVENETPCVYTLVPLGIPKDIYIPKGQNQTQNLNALL